MGREMDEEMIEMTTMTTASLEKILKAKKAEERAIENAEMKTLYSAYVESGLEIEQAIQLLKDHANHSADHRNDCCVNQEQCGKSGHKSAEDIRQGKKAREEKKKTNESREPDNYSNAGHTKPASPVFF